MGKKSLLDKIAGKKTPAEPAPLPNEAEADNPQVDGEVDHLWMKEDLEAKKPTLEKDPRVETGILRNRIAEKIAKMNNN